MLDLEYSQGMLTTLYSVLYKFHQTKDCDGIYTSFTPRIPTQSLAVPPAAVSGTERSPAPGGS